MENKMIKRAKEWERDRPKSTAVFFNSPLHTRYCLCGWFAMWKCCWPCCRAQPEAGSASRALCFGTELFLIHTHTHTHFYKTPKSNCSMHDSTRQQLQLPWIIWSGQAYGDTDNNVQACWLAYMYTDTKAQSPNFSILLLHLLLLYGLASAQV